MVGEFRTRIFEEVAASDIPGLIYTYVWDFSDDSDRRQIQGWCRPFERLGANIYFVELEASLEERLKRNETESRLMSKPSKREISRPQDFILNHETSLKLNTTDDFPLDYPLLKIDNTNLSAEDVASRIVEAFRLCGIERIP